MQRPTRIVVFGVLCLIMGAVSGLDNLGALRIAIVGPPAIEVPDTSEMGMFGEVIEDAAKATRSALGTPVYRTLFGLEAVAGAVMAGVLITAGIGLLRDRPWSARLARAWAYFALGSAALTVVLQVRFVMPQVSGMPPGGGLLATACMLPMLWLFPVLLLILLGRPVVTNYLRWRADQPTPVHATTPAIQTPSPHDRPTTPPPPAARPAAPAEPTAHADPKDTTWRDDPWNDPGGQ